MDCPTDGSSGGFATQGWDLAKGYPSPSWAQQSHSPLRRRKQPPPLLVPPAAVVATRAGLDTLQQQLRASAQGGALARKLEGGSGNGASVGRPGSTPALRLSLRMRRADRACCMYCTPYLASTPEEESFLRRSLPNPHPPTEKSTSTISTRNGATRRELHGRLVCGHAAVLDAPSPRRGCLRPQDGLRRVRRVRRWDGGWR